MPRDATSTRDRLVRAGEQRFARDGVAGARLRDVVRDAGQANDSAIGYHFGSREGLLTEIARRHVGAMEANRIAPVAGMSIDALVQQLVEPTAQLLHTPEGRDFLRIIEQLSGWAGLDRDELASAIEGSTLGRQLRALEEILTQTLGRADARARVAEFALFVAASLAQRARVLEARKRPTASHQRYVETLVSMLSAAVQVRLPSTT